MGCISPNKRIQLIHPDSPDFNIDEIPEFHYLIRSNKIAVQFKEGLINSFIFQDQALIFPDSAIGTLPAEKIIVAGGTNFNSLSKSSYIIDLTNYCFHSLPNLACPSRYGSIYFYEEEYYYIGGMTIIDNEERSLPLQICNQECWQIFNLHEFSLIHFGTCELDDRIIIFGGLRFDELGKIRASEKVFELDLETKTVSEEDISLPIPLISPICLNTSKFVFVTGGFDEDGNQNNRSIFMSLQNPHKMKEIEPVPMEISEGYFGVYTKRYVMIIQYPKMVYFNAGQKKWYTFTLNFQKIKKLKPKKLTHIEINRVQNISSVGLYLNTEETQFSKTTVETYLETPTITNSSKQNPEKQINSEIPKKLVFDMLSCAVTHLNPPEINIEAYYNAF